MGLQKLILNININLVANYKRKRFKYLVDVQAIRILFRFSLHRGRS